MISKRNYNEYYHVYVLVSEVPSHLVKVGKSSNLRRTISFSKMGYAGRTDWKHVVTFPLNSNHLAIALEALAIGELHNRGSRIKRFKWENLGNGRNSYADECFDCTVKEAITVIHDLAERLDMLLNKKQSTNKSKKNESYMETA